MFSLTVQLLADTVFQSNIGSISSTETLVRTSTSLFANYGVFTSPASPDMQRFGSPNAAGPGDNSGGKVDACDGKLTTWLGGLGTWHDANYCISIPSGSE